MPLKLKNVLTQSISMPNYVPGPSSLLQYFASLCELCHEFRDSCIFALLKASINRTIVYGNEAFN